MNRIRVGSMLDIPTDFTGIAEFTDGSMWLEATYLNGNYHSYDDLPAVRYSGGSLEWYKDGKVHRFGEFAYISSRGKGEWWLDGDRWADENNYWKECWKRYRTKENEQLIMSKLLAGK